MATKPRMRRARTAARAPRVDYSVIRPDEQELFAPVASVTDRESFVRYVNERAALSVKETIENKVPAIQLGCVHDRAMRQKWFRDEHGRPLTAEEVARQLDYSSGYLRLCRRIFLRRFHIDADVRWWQENKHRFPNYAPRKAEGLDYMWGCARAHSEFEAERERRPADPIEAIIATVDRKLAPPLEQAVEASPGQQSQRIKIILSDAIRRLKEADVELPYRFTTMNEVEDWVTHVEWNDDLDRQMYAIVQGETPLGAATIPASFFQREPAKPAETEAEQAPGEPSTVEQRAAELTISWEYIRKVPEHKRDAVERHARLYMIAERLPREQAIQRAVSDEGGRVEERPRKQSSPRKPTKRPSTDQDEQGP